MDTIIRDRRQKVCLNYWLYSLGTIGYNYNRSEEIRQEDHISKKYVMVDITCSKDYGKGDQVNRVMLRIQDYQQIKSKNISNKFKNFIGNAV